MEKLSSSNRSEMVTQRPPAPSMVPRPSGAPLSHRRAISPSGSEGASLKTTDLGAAERILREALRASSEAGATLTALLKVLGDFKSGVDGALQANESLVGELERVQLLLLESDTTREKQLHDLEELDAQLEEERLQAERERAYVADEQDRFVAALIEEHEDERLEIERQRDALRVRVAELEQRKAVPPNATDAARSEERTDLEAKLAEAHALIAQLDAERENTRQIIKKAHFQRDEAQAALRSSTRQLDELRHGKASSPSGDSWDREATPAPPPSLDPPSSGIPDVLRGEVGGSEGEGKREAANESQTQQPSSAAAVTEPPRADVEAEAAQAAMTLPPQDGKPPLKRKPDASERPLIGYSLSADEVQTERVGGVPGVSSAPPRPR